MYAALSWVPRGVAEAKIPKGVQNGDEMDVAEADDGNTKPDASSEARKEISLEETDDSDADIEQVLANDLDNLTFHQRNADDPYLATDPKANELFDEEELEDLVIRKTDALIIAAKSGDDVSTLEVHLFDDDPDASDTEDGRYKPHFYVHHDIVLPVLPLCTAYTRLKADEKYLNLVAVGMFTPGIDVWDIDRVNDLEPVTSLGGYQGSAKQSSALSAAAAVRKRSKGSKKKKPKLRLKEDSHTDAVMCLSWNNVQREYLASGSADCTLKIWDIESSHCARTLSHHADKVQSVAFHPTAAETLVTGSFDKTVHMIDVRNNEAGLSWSVETDVESCQWGAGPTSGMIIVTTEDGYVSVFDPRTAKSGKRNTYLTRWNAHAGAASALSVSQDIPGLMASGGVDKTVKIWDISNVAKGKPGEKIYERPSKAGAVFALSLCPMSSMQSNSSPFVAAYGGAQGCLRIVDFAVESEAVRDRFLHNCSSAASEAIVKRSARTKQAAISNKMDDDGQESTTDEEEENDSASSGWESDHSL